MLQQTHQHTNAHRLYNKLMCFSPTQRLLDFSHQLLLFSSLNTSNDTFVTPFPGSHDSLHGPAPLARLSLGRLWPSCRLFLSVPEVVQLVPRAAGLLQAAPAASKVWTRSTPEARQLEERPLHDLNQRLATEQPTKPYWHMPPTN